MLFYRLLTIILSPIILGHIIWISIKNRQSKYFWQRLGFGCSHLPENSLWFHCASVGEVNTLLPLLNNIHQKDGKLKFIITTNTVTGKRIVTSQKLDYLFHTYLPFDWNHSTKRFLATTKPTAVYIMETEIWPNLFTNCFSNNTPITLINARLSKKTTSANTWIKSLLKKTLSNVSAIYTRSDKDKQLYINLGAKKELVNTLGNLKLTTTLHNAPKTNTLFSSERTYVLVASTHKEEELQIYNIWKELKRKELLIIAPRHPERSTVIVKQLNCREISVKSKSDAITNRTQVYLLDTIGELKNYFLNAQFVIMGGSFSPIGGHNIVEPASFNSAIITGPHMENFNEELELMLRKKAILQVSSIEKLKQQIEKLLENAEYRNTLKNNTKKLLDNSTKTLDVYTNYILQNNSK
jgi:3-deoxy-D-manno-octulosonic-acid transferase